MPLEKRQLSLLSALAETDQRLRDKGRPTDFLLLRMPGGRMGLKPGIETEEELAPTEADVLDLQAEDYVHLLPSTSGSVVAKFALSASGRTAGRPRAVRANLGGQAPDTAPPSLDDVLGWLAGLEGLGSGSAILADGGALINEAMARFGTEHLGAVASRLIDLRDGGLLLFDDPAALLEQISDADRLGMGGQFRLTVTGRDRAVPRPSAANITQIIHAAQAQVAAGNIHNYVSFEQLLDRVDRALEEVDRVDEDTRAEARTMLDKLRAASGTIATGTATSAGGTLLGAVLKQALGLP